MSDHVLVVGASLAGYKAIRELRTLGHDGLITLVGEETVLPYDRPPLSKGCLTGTHRPADLALCDQDELATLDVDVLLGTRAVALDRARDRVLLDDGEDLPYRNLLVTTGARARLPAWYRPLEGVHLLRSAADAEAIRADLSNEGPIAVVGGGFIGTEAAAALASTGRQVTVVAEGRNFLEPLGEFAAEFLTDLHRARGVTPRTGRTVVELTGQHRVQGVTLDDGSTVEATTVLVSTGAQPNSEWLGELASPRTGAVATDSAGRVDRSMWAAGDVTTAGSGHWFSAVRQARRAARGITGVDNSATARLDAELPYFWTDQFELKVQVVGSVQEATAVPVLHHDDPVRIVVAYERGGRVTGALVAGRPRDLVTARSIVRDGAEMSSAVACFTSDTAPV